MDYGESEMSKPTIDDVGAAQRWLRLGEGGSSDETAAKLLEELWRENEELAQSVCDQCDGDGWNENREQGKVPCVCVAESEPYRELLEAALAFQQLATCYRVGRTPSEALFRRLEKAREALERAKR
jgi:hypothetical protein